MLPTEKGLLVTKDPTLPLTPDILALYAAALPATRQGALYNAMSYPTKISAEAVALFIATHTVPGESVLDVFGGSGSTGLAAILCERPTPRMLDAVTRLGLSPTWGARDAVVYDISEIGTHTARVLSSPPEPKEFERAASSMLDEAQRRLAGAYAATDPDGESGEILHTIWTEFIVCSQCGLRTAYADARVRWEPLRFADSWVCDCGAAHGFEASARETETVRDALTGELLERRVREPWRVYGRTGKKRWSRAADETDKMLASSFSGKTPPAGTPVAPLVWGDLYRSGYHFGMTHLHHLYTSRNFFVLATCWEIASSAPEPMREALQALVLSYNASHSTLMTRVVLKKQSKDFVLTGAQSGVLYVSALPVEKNVLTGIARKVKTFADAFAITHGAKSHVRVVTGSSTSLDLQDSSIEYCFTDPPFGDYIPYAEINQVNELWLGTTTDATEEAVVSVAQSKGVSNYQSLLSRVFREVARVLKPTAPVTVVFHSAKAEVWRSLAEVFTSSGLSVHLSSVLDKTQGSFKQVLGENSVQGDPLLLLYKFAPNASDVSERAPEDGKEQSRERLYARYVGESLAQGQSVTIDAKQFYKTHAAVSR